MEGKPSLYEHDHSPVTATAYRYCSRLVSGMFRNIYQKPDFLNPPVDFKKIPGADCNKPEYVINSAFKFRLNLSVCSQFQHADIRQREGHRDGRGDNRHTAWHDPRGARFNIYIYIYIYTHTHTYIYIYTHTHTHIYIYTHTHIYIYIHTYIFINSFIIFHESITGYKHHWMWNLSN